MSLLLKLTPLHLIEVTLKHAFIKEGSSDSRLKSHGRGGEKQTKVKRIKYQVEANNTCTFEQCLSETAA